MSVSRAMRRLLRIRELEEEQRRLALESATEELRRLEAARAASLALEKCGRALVRSGAHSGEIAERVAGLEETRLAVRRGEVIAGWIVEAQAVTETRRAEFLNKRVERRQAETLVEESEKRDEREGQKHAQRTLDDWYSARLAMRDRPADVQKPSEQREET